MCCPFHALGPSGLDLPIRLISACPADQIQTSKREILMPLLFLLLCLVSRISCPGLQAPLHILDTLIHWKSRDGMNQSNDSLCC
jgi:hypothetical protein